MSSVLAGRMYFNLLYLLAVVNVAFPPLSHVCYMLQMWMVERALSVHGGLHSTLCVPLDGELELPR